MNTVGTGDVTTHRGAKAPANDLDVDRIRGDFPILRQKINGHPLAYLDNAATTQKPDAVIDAMSDFLRTSNANVHRGIHTLSERATAAYEGAREKIARFIGAESVKNVVFTRNTTESINLVAHGWGRKSGSFGRRYVDSGDEILLTEMEHHSNLVPWQILAQETGAQLRFVPIADDGHLALGELPRLLTPRTRIVSIVHVSNVVGTINPVAEIVRTVREHSDAIVLVDGAQAVPHMPVNVREVGADFYAFSGHKMAGPTGIGVLYGRTELLLDMNPFLGGGDMIRTVWFDKALWNELPYKFEAGTPAIAEAVGLGAAVDYLAGIGMDRVFAHGRALARYALDRLAAARGIRIFGPLGDRAALVAFSMDGVHPHDIATLLDQEGVAIRAGHHCAQPLLRKLGVISTARASFYVYNRRDEIDRLAGGLDHVRTVFAA